MYSQTYIVKTKESNAGGGGTSRHAFFQVGNHCYSGEIQLSLQHAFGGVFLKDIPSLIPLIIKQQSALTYLCDSSKVPVSNQYHLSLNEMEWARNFVISELTSDSIANSMAKLTEKHSWIDDDKSSTYFELIGDVSSRFTDILFIASRTHAQGLCFITIYFEGTIYVVLEDSESHAQPLIDINFPDISRSGEGATLALYDDVNGKGNNGPWMKLSIWQIISVDNDTVHKNQQVEEDEVQPTVDETQEVGIVEQPPTKDVSCGDSYVQSYIILKGDTHVRKCLFRFGNWIYEGSVELITNVSLSDIPLVIQSLRVQQSKLEFVSDISSLPLSNPFASAIAHATKRQSLMQNQAVESLNDLLSAGHDWLEDKAGDTFFEFDCCNDNADNNPLENVDVLAIKSYTPNGIISISLYYDGNWYLILDEGKDDLPLLDSKFPDVSCKNQEHDIQSYSSGIDDWPELRKLSVCCSSNKPVSTTQPSDEIGAVRKQARMEMKLKTIDEGDSNKDTAWDTDGKPIAEKDAIQLSPNVDDISGNSNERDISDDDDIYAQLDRLDQQLEHEIKGLKDLDVG